MAEILLLKAGLDQGGRHHEPGGLDRPQGLAAAQQAGFDDRRLLRQQFGEGGEALVIGQIALTAALLIAATLEIRSIRNQLQLDYGYDENAIYSARMALLEGAYTEDGRREFFKRAVRELRGNPEFDSAALSDRLQMTFAGGGQYEVDGQNYLTDRDRPRGNFESVSDKYFSTLGLKILEGRDFTIDDADTKQPVAIVNEFVDGDIYRWGSLMAGALAGSLPLVILYAFFVEHYVSAMTGAVKE